MAPSETNGFRAPETLTIREVVARTAVSRATVYRLIESGDFPKPVKVSPKRVVWLVSEVDAWWQRKLGERSA